MKSLYRPKLHFTPAKNWMNDPNGLVYDAYTKEYLCLPVQSGS